MNLLSLILKWQMLVVILLLGRVEAMTSLSQQPQRSSPKPPSHLIILEFTLLI
jgi:hypothetical protein